MRWFFASVAGASLVAALVWGRAAMIRLRFLRRVEIDTTDPDARLLATSSLAQLAHAAGVYAAIAMAEMPRSGSTPACADLPSNVAVNV